jgi:hypothetical protein
MPAFTTRATAATTARRGLIVALLVVTIGANATARGDEGDAFARADAEAEAFAATPEGKEYGEAVGRSFGRDHAATINRCAKTTKRPDLSKFDLLLRIDATGVVQEVLVKPETNLAVCVSRALKGWKVAAPPRPDAWVKVAVALKRK